MKTRRVLIIRTYKKERELHAQLSLASDKAKPWQDN